MVTAIGVIIIGIALVVALVHPDYLIGIAIIASVFMGAAVVNLPIVGIPPYYAVLLIVAVRCLSVRFDSSQFLGLARRNVHIMAATFVLTAVGVVGAFALPVIFAGTKVNVPREGMGEHSLAPLSLSVSNFGQAGYLVLNAVLIWYAATASHTWAGCKATASALHVSGIIVAFFAIYQVISKYTGIPYPSDFLYCNEHVAILSGDSVGGFPRLTSTFTETAGMCPFLLGYTAFIFVRLVDGRRSVFEATMLVVNVMLLLMSTSSTAYLGLVVLSVALAYGFGWRRFLRTRGDARFIAWAIVIVIVLGGAVIGALMAFDGLRDVVWKALFEKQDSESFSERSAGDLYALHLLIRTFGLGVGLGSNRASSFAASVPSNIGVLGTMAFIWLVSKLILAKASTPSRAWLVPLQWAAATVLGSAVISAPDLSSPTLWVLMAAATQVIAVSDRRGFEPIRGDRNARQPKRAVRLAPSG